MITAILSRIVISSHRPRRRLHGLGVLRLVRWLLHQTLGVFQTSVINVNVSIQNVFVSVQKNFVQQHCIQEEEVMPIIAEVHQEHCETMTAHKQDVSVQMSSRLNAIKSLVNRIVPQSAHVRSIIGIAMLIYAFRMIYFVAHCVLYPCFRLLFGTLYPAYASYKAVKSKSTKEYLKWMMYWIVFALFTSMETITDVFLNWLPFYYEIKIILVIWLLSPATKGSSFLYRKFVHPMLSSREQEIDEYISKAKEQGYKQVLDMGSKGVSALMQTALKSGGGLVNQIRKSYSLSDLTESLHEMRKTESNDDADELDRLVSPHRRKRASNTSSMYFSEIDVRADTLSAQIKSAEDISSGYSSNETLQAAKLSRAGSLRARPTRVTRSAVVPPPKKAATTDHELQGGFKESEEDDEWMRGKHCEERALPDASASEVVDVRGGKYHKRHAPEPPAIKATLVLQPGVIKPIGDEEVFCNSRSRSKTRSRSQSRSRSASPACKMYKRLMTKSEAGASPMTKLIGLFKDGEKGTSTSSS